MADWNVDGKLLAALNANPNADITPIKQAKLEDVRRNAQTSRGPGTPPKDEVRVMLLQHNLANALWLDELIGVRKARAGKSRPLRKFSTNSDSPLPRPPTGRRGIVRRLPDLEQGKRQQARVPRRAYFLLKSPLNTSFAVLSISGFRVPAVGKQSTENMLRPQKSQYPGKDTGFI